MMARRAARPAAVLQQPHHTARPSQPTVRFQGRFYSSGAAVKAPKIVHVQDLVDKVKKNNLKEKSSIQTFVQKYPLHAQFACANVDFRDTTALDTYVQETKRMIISRKKDLNKLDFKGKNVMYHALNSLPTLYCRMAVDLPSKLVNELLLQDAQLVETQFQSESALTHLNYLSNIPILYARIPEITRLLLQRGLVSPIRPNISKFSPLWTTLNVLHHNRMPAERTLVALFNTPGFKINDKDFEFDGTVYHWLFRNSPSKLNEEVLRKLYLSVYLLTQHSASSLNNTGAYYKDLALDLFIKNFSDSCETSVQFWRNAIITHLHDRGAKCSDEKINLMKPTYPTYGDYFKHRVRWSQSFIYNQPFSKVVEQLSGPPEPWEVY